jgi:porphobilinogen synthase
MPTNPSRNARLLRPLESPKPDLPGETSASSGHGQYPRVRMRQTGRQWTRRLVAENRLAIGNDLAASCTTPTAVPTSPPCPAFSACRSRHWSMRLEPPRAWHLAVALFPVVPGERKTRWPRIINPDNLCNRAVRAVRQAVPNWHHLRRRPDPTSRSHDGVLRDGRILNDETIAILCQQALAQAAAGVDVVAPSDMTAASAGCAEALDATDRENVRILAYPRSMRRRSTVRSATPGSKVRSAGRQTDLPDGSGNTDEALREYALDIAGAPT